MPLIATAGVAASAAVSAAKSVFFGGGGAAAAGGAMTAKEVFDYNRANFKEDRDQRMKKEFQERKMRMKQAYLWREDVRDFVSLTERKMKYYLLVNVLLLGFNVTLWCEGRLPEQTPAWLMMGNQIATAGSFLFLLLTVWLSMHAAVAAQSYQARVLTQLVRLPVPTWAELEACRTYASEFEQLEPRQMFRVPFVAGSQEDIARERAASAAAPSASCLADATDAAGAGGAVGAAGAASCGVVASEVGSMAADPWGLERRGDDIYELGTHYGADVAKLRHMKIIRQAAVYWQTYDAFARVSMSVGVNQLMLAMSYFILGYVMCQVQCPAAAFAAVLCLIGTMEVVARIDLTLPTGQQRVIQFLLAFGPVVSCIAAYEWGLGYDATERIAQGLAPLAFLSHGVVLALMTFFLRVAEQQNGAMLPLAFQGVLYLDVFGWIHEKGSQETTAAEANAAGEAEEGANMAATIAGPAGFDLLSPSFFESSAAKAAPSMAHASSNRHSFASAQRFSRGVDRPAVASVGYDEHGRARPTRPDDMMPPGAEQDMRRVPGAPRMTDTISAVTPPAKDFFEPVTFMPPEGRRRHMIDELFEDHPVGRPRGPYGSGAAGQDGELRIETGHDNESPGRMPWTIFKSSAMLLVFVWFTAAFVAFVEIAELRRNMNPWWVVTEAEDEFSFFSKAVSRHVVPAPSIFALWASGLSGAPVGPPPEGIDVTWPYRSMHPRGFSCDASGSRFLVTDGLSTFEASLRGAGSGISAARGGSGSFRDGRFLAVEEEAWLGTPRANFRPATHCAALRGEAVSDTALICRGNATDGASCQALVLHRKGQRLAMCALGAPAAQGLSGHDARGVASQAMIARGWLEQGGTDLHDAPEEVEWILADHACADSSAQPVHDGCASVGTSRGRVVRLKQASTAAAATVEDDAATLMVPSDMLGDMAEEDEGSKGDLRDARSPGVVRAFNKRYIGVLQAHRMSIRVLDLDEGGAPAGTILLRSHAREGGDSVTGFCAGGGHLYLMGTGASPPIWRVALPEGLWPQPSATSRA